MHARSLLSALAGLIAAASAGWAQPQRDLVRVARDNCGVVEEQPHLIRGADYRYPLEGISGELVAKDSPTRTVAFGERVILEYHGLSDGAAYQLRLTFLSDGNDRVQRVAAGDITLIDELVLPWGNVLERALDVPGEAIVEGVLSLEISRLTGPNAVVSEVELWSDDSTPVRPRPLPVVEVPRLSPRPASVDGVKTPRISLNGTWQFNPSPPDGFSTLSEVNGWSDFEVPGEWAMQDFRVEPTVAAGVWRRFGIPADWSGKRIKLRFDGVWSDCTVWVNSRQVGGHMGGFTPFELDITEAAHPGRNTLALGVTSESVADILASASQYAVHPLGGIPRKVELFAVPNLHLAAMVVTTTFDTEFRDATLNVRLDIANEGAVDVRGASVRLTLTDPSGQPVALDPEPAGLPTIEAGQVLTHTIKLPVVRPLKWDPEHPNLYHLDCMLQAPEHPALTVSRRVGFRQVQVRGNRVFVNGRPIKLRGVNRHEVHPRRGRSLMPGQWRRDAELFRAANVNYIRTSHYPPAEEFLDACDELGLFVECEAPLCWVQHGANPNWRRPAWNYQDPGLFVPLARANLENVATNRHHPSIIIWSLANESRWSRLFAEVLRLVEASDPTRLTSFHDQCWGGYNNAGSKAQIANYHYPGPDWSTHVAAEQRPVLFGEYCHLNTYNRHEIATDPGLRDAWGLALGPMWEAMSAADGCLGGALWSGIDDTFLLPDGRTVGYGSWGSLDGWRRPKPEYWHMKKVYSPVRVLTRRLSAPVAGEPLLIELANRYDFTNLREVQIDWSIGSQTGRFQADLPPRSQGTIAIRPDRQPADGDVLELTFTDPRGFDAEHVHVPIGGAAARRAPPRGPAAGTVEIEETDSAYAVHGGTFSCWIRCDSGQITKASVEGIEVLTGGPALMILPLNRAGATQMAGERKTYTTFTPTCTDWEVEEISETTLPRGVLIEISGRYREAAGSYSIQIDEQGSLTIGYHFAVSRNVNPRQVGLVFDLPRQFHELSWQRNAQWSVYPGDHIGRPVGTARAFADAELSGSAGPRSDPALAWAHDYAELGTNDFRSMKRNVLWAALRTESGHGVEVFSDGSQHVRTWVDGECVRLLVADYSNLGAERFLRSYARRFERPLKVGDAVRGQVRLRLSSPSHRREAEPRAP